jgi:hypothetical protein
MPDWKAGGVHETIPTYPGCVTKLAWLPVLATDFFRCGDHWRQHASLLEAAFKTSTNPEYGQLIDLATGLSNQRGDASTAGFAKFARSRFRAEELLSSKKLLFPGERHTNKTYPSNSGEEPTGFEKALYGVRLSGGPGTEATTGRNAMSPIGAAYLMLSLADGHIPGVPRDEVKRLFYRPALTADLWGMGNGLPGAIPFYTKGGCGNEAVNEVIIVQLPASGVRLVVAVFTDLHREPYRHHTPLGANLVLGEFMELLLRRLALWDTEVEKSGMVERRLQLDPVATVPRTMEVVLDTSRWQRFRILARATEALGVRGTGRVPMTAAIVNRGSSPVGDVTDDQVSTLGVHITDNGVWQVMAPAIRVSSDKPTVMTVTVDERTTMPYSLSLRVLPIDVGP